MKNTLLPTLLIVSIVAFSLISCGGSGSSGGADGASGDNACQTSGYEAVSDIDELKAIGTDEASMAKNYCLTADIDLSTDGDWLSLGGMDSSNDNIHFTGNFDGQGKTISNMVVAKGRNAVGLFANIRGNENHDRVTIKNLILKDFTVEGGGFVGVLAGYVEGSVTISKVKALNVTVKGENTNVGGLVGEIVGKVIIENSSVLGGVISGNGRYVGGLVGGISGDGKILNSYATNAVAGSGDIGGLIGIIHGGGGAMVTNSYATGEVKGDKQIGGLIGGVEGDNNIKLLNSYATGMVTASVKDKGGLVGKLNDCTTAKCSFTNSYFDKSGTNSGINAIGSGINSATITGLVGVNGANDIVKAADGSSNLKSTSATKIFVDWETDIWKTDTGKWPILRKQCKQVGFTEIYDIASLKKVGTDAASMGKDYCLTADIDLAGVADGFPLGWDAGYADIIDFTGNLDGEGHTISNLMIDKDTSNYMGLFSKIKPEGGKSSEIKNLILDEFDITGLWHVGALAGYANNEIIISKVKINNAMINGTNYIGGLVGLIEGLSGMINDSAVIGGTVTGKGYYAGGMVGIMRGQNQNNGVSGDLTISNSYATIAVTGGESVGGLVGGISVGGIILNSYAAGAVTGSGNDIGGLVGEIYADGDSADIKVANSYAAGAVKGGSNVGGLVGIIVNRGRISNSYATGMVTITGTRANKGSLIGYISCSIQATDKNHCEATNSYFDKSANSGINAIGAITGGGNPTIIGLVGVDGASDIGVAAGGGFQTIASPNSKIFVDWNKDKDIWQIMAGAWPTFKP